MRNQLVVVENEKLTVVPLDDRLCWEIGRPGTENRPDIPLYSATVSRRHGRLQNMDGIWFYLDYNGRNGTVYHDKRIRAGLQGQVKPVMLSDGDVLIFGGGEKPEINERTVWAMYSVSRSDDGWRVADTRGYERLVVADPEGEAVYEHPQKGLVVRRRDGIAIYMGGITYVTGAVTVVQR